MVIAKVPIYQNDERYGGLLVVPPPFNVLSPLLIIPFLLVKEEYYLRKMNSIFCKITFLPQALFLGCFFVIGNVILLPFGYLAGIYKKIKLTLLNNIVKKRKKWEEVLDLLIFVIFGLPMLAISQLTDLYFFMLHIYREDIEKYDMGTLEYCLCID